MHEETFSDDVGQTNEDDTTLAQETLSEASGVAVQGSAPVLAVGVYQYTAGQMEVVNFLDNKLEQLQLHTANPAVENFITDLRGDIKAGRIIAD